MPKFSPAVSRLRRLPSLLAAFALVAFAAGCDNSSGTDQSVASLAVNPGTHTLTIGATRQLVATATTSSGSILSTPVTFVSSAPLVASVSPNGLVTALAGGTTTITATGGGKSADAIITVWYALRSIALAGAGGATTIRQEGSLQLTPTFVDATGATVTGRQVSWTTSNPAVATTSTGGNISGLIDGTATITATSGTTIGTFLITVSGAPVVATVTMAPTLGRHMAPGMTDQFVATARAASGTLLSLTGRTVVWASATPANATVSATGLVAMIVNNGTSIITVRVDGVAQTTALTAVGRPELALGTVTNGTIASGAFQDWVINVPAGTTSLSITTAGGTGDPDLYLYRPALTSAAPVLQCYSGASGPGESCAVTNPAAGRWFMQIEAWSGAGAATGTTITLARTP